MKYISLLPSEYDNKKRIRTKRGKHTDMLK